MLHTFSRDGIGEVESGERYEAISYYKNDIKFTIGAEREFINYTKYIKFR